MYDKKDVEYTDHGTKDQHCLICRHYADPKTCRIVVGKIVPYGWCNKFKLLNHGGDGPTQQRY